MFLLFDVSVNLDYSNNIVKKNMTAFINCRWVVYICALCWPKSIVIIEIDSWDVTALCHYTPGLNTTVMSATDEAMS